LVAIVNLFIIKENYDDDDDDRHWSLCTRVR